MECVWLNCRGPAGALVVTRPQGVKSLGAEMKKLLDETAFQRRAHAHVVDAENWEGPGFQNPKECRRRREGFP